MEDLFATAGLITVAVITPGPNNSIVAREAARGGWKRALPVGVGVILGGLAVLATGLAGAGALGRADATVLRGLGLVSSVALVVLGVVLVYRGGERRPSPPAMPLLRRGGVVAGMLLFQFVNPKSWLLVTAVASPLGPRVAEQGDALSYLVGMFLVIPTAALGLWAAVGSVAMPRLSHPRARAWCDRIVGGLLVAFALVLLTGGLGVD